MKITGNWLNLCVSDLKQSEDFYSKIGFEIKKNEEMLDKMLGVQTADGHIIMLIEQQQFKKAANVNDTTNNGALVSVSVSTSDEVDELLALVDDTNGKVLQRGTKLEGFYGGLFSDPDGNRFNIIAM
jgi:predicted lactoylglutathione lyase